MEKNKVKVLAGALILIGLITPVKIGLTASHPNPERIQVSDRRLTENETADATNKHIADEERHWKMDEADAGRSLEIQRKVFCLTAVLALINVFVMFIYFVTMRASIRAANAAKISADAATKGSRAAERTFYTATRPWVLISDFEIGPSDVGPMITYKVYNAGSTPAILDGLEIVARASAFEPREYTESLESTFTRVIAIHVPLHTDTKNGFLLRDFRPDSLSGTELREIQTGKKWLYCYGLVRYRGVMNEVWNYETGFGAWHQGDCSTLRTKMEPMTNPKVNYVH